MRKHDITLSPRGGVGEEPPPDENEAQLHYAFRLGGDFILDTPADPSPIWGEGEDVLLADGEALIIAGPQGLGKTTLAQQLLLGRAGIGEYSTLLGFPIQPGQGTALYLAMDRPRQAARSFRRMVGESWRGELNDSVRVWQGPPPQDLARLPALLARLCDQAGADTVVVDSLKDAAVGLNDDEVGAGYNRARQHAVTAGVQVIELHHNRKQQGGRTAPPTIDDVYGSTWLPSGAGSVILLSGAPGDPIVNLHHIKQPAAEVGPLKTIHDHATGRSSVWHATDLVRSQASSEGSPHSMPPRRCSMSRSPTRTRRRRRAGGSKRSSGRATWWCSTRATNRPTAPRSGGRNDLHDHLHGTPRGRDLHAPCMPSTPHVVEDLHADLHDLHADGPTREGGSLNRPSRVLRRPGVGHTGPVQQDQQLGSRGRSRSTTACPLRACGWQSPAVGKVVHRLFIANHLLPLGPRLPKSLTEN